MRLLTDSGELAPRIKTDPRLSRSQLDQLLKMGAADERATFAGLDQKMRPVVFARLPYARNRTRTALMRNGDPAKPEMPLAERWP